MQHTHAHLLRLKTEFPPLNILISYVSLLVHEEDVLIIERKFEFLGSAPDCPNGISQPIQNPHMLPHCAF